VGALLSGWYKSGREEQAESKEKGKEDTSTIKGGVRRGILTYQNDKETTVRDNENAFPLTREKTTGKEMGSALTKNGCGKEG